MGEAVLSAPHGGHLVDLMASDSRKAALAEIVLRSPSIRLTPRQLCDLELLLCGGFSPLTGFLNKADYESVVDTMRLTSGELWPMPVMLELTEADVKRIGEHEHVVLRDVTGLTLAVLKRGRLVAARQGGRSRNGFRHD